MESLVAYAATAEGAGGTLTVVDALHTRVGAVQAGVATGRIPTIV
jgi:hypothetical protein